MQVKTRKSHVLSFNATAGQRDHLNTQLKTSVFFSFYDEFVRLEEFD